ncbi:uncharacterized protein [Ptychodera flava]|uniref:uncharacterized protein n=1 Tax=Ptychodera flava TaxID=63121 RepID=UPI00396A72EA
MQHKRQQLSIQPKSYKKVIVEGDGNCLFRAISQGIYGTQDHHNAIRLQTINYIIDHWDEYEEPIKGEYERWHINNPDQYKQFMSKSEPGFATYGGDIELTAAAFAYNVNIVVHLDIQSEPLKTVGNSSVTVHLLYHPIRVRGEIDSGHYDFLQSIETHLTWALNAGDALDETDDMSAITRSCTNYRECEKERDRIAKRQKRKQSGFRENEKITDFTRKRTKRSNDIWRQREQQRNAHSMKLRRSDEVYRESEQQRNAQSMKLRRSDEVYRESEQQRNANSMKLRRSDEVYRESEQQRNAQSMKLRRSDEVYRESEQQRNANSMKLRRSDEVYRESEQQRNANSMKLRRSDEVYRESEQQRNANSMKLRRSDEVYRQNERHKDVIAKKNKRNSSAPKSTEQLIENFHESVRDGPTFVCVCCEQLWYRESVVNYNNIKSKLSVFALTHINATDDEMLPLCKTCYSYLKDSKLPPCAITNKMSFPVIPPELQLHPLEERLVALRIPFMQIRELPRGRQVSLRGNIVNVISDVSSTVSTLPRTLNESQTIPVKFKRKISYSHAYQVQNVRPQKVFQAAKWLIENSPLYKAEKVTVSTCWDVCEKNGTNVELREFCDDSGCNRSSQTSESENCKHDGEHENNHDDDDDDDDGQNKKNIEDHLGGTLDTMLSHLHDDHTDSEGAFCYAPGEGNRPLGIFQDKYSEELSFPTIYCGQPRPSERLIPVSYSTLCKWEMRHKDRRVAKSVPNIFFKVKKLQIQQIKDKATLCLRKCNLKGRKVTAGEIQSPQNVDKIVRLDEGFRVLKTLRGSPPYWESAKRDIFAMIRQLGIPTFFMSFSSAESKWIHLLKILGKTVHDKEYTENEIRNMSWSTKSELIKSDPVTCARHFDRTFQRFMHDFLMSSLHPVGEIQDFFYRVEFQQRGSPHIHMLLWIKDSPQYNENSDDEVTKFIDQYITCDNDTDDESFAELINYQMHRHAKTCKIKGQCVCRFGFPVPPMPRTMILQPLPMDIDDSTEQTLKEHYARIKSVLADLQFGENLSFSEFLDKLQLDETTYINAVQSSLTSDKIFLKRSPNEIRINNYNEILLKAWRANMDIQFIIDPYACAMYIASYISKAQRGMSNLLARAVDEVREGNQDIRESVRHIGNKFLNHVEVSAQEAVYLTMQMKLRRASRSFIFVNTSPPDDRVILLKPLDEIQNMKENATDIESDNILKKYEQRPKAIEKLCLADLAAWYTFQWVKDDQQDQDKDNDELYHSEDDDSQTSYRVGGLLYKKRTKSKVIRYVRFHKEKDRENYYRELIMLFYHWRHENQYLLVVDTYYDRYLQIKQEVDAKEKEYNKNAEALDQAIEAVQNTAMDMFDNVAPNTQHQERQDCAQGPSDTMNIFAPHNSSHSQYDIGQDIGIAVNNPNMEELHQPRMANSELYPLLQTLNKKQKQIFII